MRLRILSFLAAGTVALALAVPSPAAAEETTPPSPRKTFTTQGGTTMEPGRNAVEAAIGWPGVRLGGRIPLKTGFEVGPYVTFSYWNDLLDKKATLGNSLGCLVKVHLVDKGKFQLAVQGDPSFTLEYWPDGTKLGWQIGFPEILMSYEITKGMDLDFGFKFPLSLVFDSDYQVEIRLPLLLGMGVEVELDKDLSLFAGFNIGPNFRFAKEQPKVISKNRQGYEIRDWNNTTGGNRTGAYLDVMVGISYRIPQ